jgi:hypothetical protein
MGKEKLSPAALRRNRLALAGLYDSNANYARGPVSGAELRARIDRLGFPYARVAGWLGLSVDGLHKQMRGDRKVTPQTVLVLIEIEQGFMHQANLPSWHSTAEAKHFRRRQNELL